MERDIIITNMDKSSEIPQGKPESKRAEGAGRRANPQEAKDRLDFIKRKAEAFKGETELPFSDALGISRAVNDINDDKDVLVTREELTGFKKTAERIFKPEDVAKMGPADVVIAAHHVLTRSEISNPSPEVWEYDAESPARREEEASAREQIAKAKEAELDPQKTAEHLEVIQEKTGKVSKKSGPGTMGPIGEWWEEGLPPETELSESLKNHINVIKMVSQSGRVSKQVIEDLESAKNNILTEMQRGGLVGDRNAEALWLNVSERQRLLLGVLTEQSSDKDPAMIRGQKVMYGMTTIPKARELDEFLEENKTSNLAVLFASPEFKDEIGKYKELFPADLVKYKVEPEPGDAEYAEKLKFHEFYKALKKDQEAWVHETLNRLPLQDISREALQSDINYREFELAQPDMILEVAEYARALDYAYSAKYIFYSNGAKALGQFSNLLTKAYYTLATKAPGWAEVVNEIENMAEARYHVERDSSGLVVSAKPKTEKELIKERSGKDKWKIGGLVQHDHEDLDTIRTHLIDGVKEVIAQKLGLDTTKDAKEIEARAKIAAFLGEWLGWRMAGRSAHWGEQGKEGYAGENAHFKVINFQRYANQEDKGHREMRQMLFGTDNIKDMIYDYAPGQAGGLNFNVGFFDYYSQYAGVYHGERYPKTLHRAGFRRGTDASGNDKRLNEIERRMDTAMDRAGLNSDQEKDEAQRAALSDDDRKFLNEYNNLPIFSLGGTRGLESLENIARGFEKGGLVVNGKAEVGDRDPRLWSIYDDVGDFFGGDLEGADKTASMMVDPLNGFMWEPNVDKIGAVLTVHEGRKRIWQRSKLAYDLAESLLEFRATLNKKLKKSRNWRADDIDVALTEMRKARFFDEGIKKRLEKEVYPKVTPAWEKALTLGFTRSPFIHKLVWVYGKNTAEPLVLGALVGLKELIARLMKAFNTTLNTR